MSSAVPRRAEARLVTEAESSDGEAIRHEIARLREDLGETINALSEKTDVKAQASARAGPVIAGAIALVVVVWMVRRRRRRRA
jgi:uncharacterized protein (TIGR03382 family)